MDTFNRFEAADIILEYIDRPEHHSNMFSAENIKNELFPNENADTIQSIFEFIDNCGVKPAIAKLENKMWVRRTVNTAHFIHEGGFSKIHNDNLSKSEHKTEKENLELQQLRSDNILKTNQLVDYEKTKRNLKKITNATIAVAIIALLELILLLIK